MVALIATAFLIPLNDNDGLPFPRTLMDELHRRLLDLQADSPDGAGFSTRRVHGVWVYDGRAFNDESVEYSIGFASWRNVRAWLDVAEWARETFRQEAIFITILGVQEALGP